MSLKMKAKITELIDGRMLLLKFQYFHSYIVLSTSISYHFCFVLNSQNIFELFQSLFLSKMIFSGNDLIQI